MGSEMCIRDRRQGDIDDGGKQKHGAGKLDSRQTRQPAPSKELKCDESPYGMTQQRQLAVAARRQARQMIEVGEECGFCVSDLGVEVKESMIGRSSHGLRLYLEACQAASVD